MLGFTPLATVPLGAPGFFGRIVQLVLVLHNTQLLSYRRAISKAVILTSSHQLVILLKAPTKIIPLLSPEIVKERLSVGKIALLNSPQSVTTSSSPVKSVIMASSELVSLAKIVFRQRVFALTSSQIVSISRSTGKNILLSSSELLSIIRVIGRQLTIMSSQSLSIVRSTSKRILIISSELATIALISARNRILVIALPQSISVSKYISKSVSLMTSHELFTLIKSAQHQVSITTSQSLAVSRINIKRVFLTTHQLLSVIPGAIRPRLILLSSPQLMAFSRVKPAAVKIINMVSHQLTTLKKLQGKGFLIPFPQIITAAKRPIIHIVPRMIQGQTLTVARRIPRHFTLLNTQQVILITTRQLAHMIGLLQQQHVSVQKAASVSKFMHTVQSMSIKKSISKSIKVVTAIQTTIKKSVRKLVIFPPITQVFTHIAKSSKLIRFSTSVRASLRIATQKVLTGRVSQAVTLRRKTSRTIWLYTKSTITHIKGFRLFGRVSQAVSLRKQVAKSVRFLQPQHLARVIMSRDRLLAMIAGQRVMVRKAIGKIISFKTHAKLALIKSRTETLHFITHSVVTLKRALPKVINLHTAVITRLTKSVDRVFKLKTLQNLRLVKRINKILIGTIGQKITAGRLWYVVIQFTTPVKTTMTKSYNKTIRIIQSSAIWVYVKVRTLIQRAVVLLVGA